MSCHGKFVLSFRWACDLLQDCDTIYRREVFGGIEITREYWPRSFVEGRMFWAVRGMTCLRENTQLTRWTSFISVKSVVGAHDQRFGRRWLSIRNLGERLRQSVLSRRWGRVAIGRREFQRVFYTSKLAMTTAVKKIITNNSPHV